MGQQQLLLLVLSTVIVGLATVAGIQAFSENQQQATQDALIQRAINIGNDIVAAHNEPGQFGGIDATTAGASEIATAAGYDSDTPSADGAGDNAECAITTGSDPAVTISCASQGNTGSNSGGNDEEEYIEVGVNPTTDNVTVMTVNDDEVTPGGSV